MGRSFVGMVAFAALVGCGPAPIPAAPPAPASSEGPAPTILEGDAAADLLQQDPLVVRLTPNRAEPHERELYIVVRPGAEKWFPFLWDDKPNANSGAMGAILATQPMSVELRTEGDVTVMEVELFRRQLAAAGVTNLKVVLAPAAPPPETEPPAVLKERKHAAEAAHPKPLPAPPPLIEGRLPSNLVEDLERAQKTKIPSLGSPGMIPPPPTP